MADSGPALDSAIRTAAGRAISIAPGTYRIAGPRTLSTNTVLYGSGATFRFDFVGAGLTGSGVSFEAHGITFDGTGKATTLVKLSSSSFVLDGVTMKNVYGSASATSLVAAFHASAATYGKVIGSTFTNVHAVGNGTIGDLVGTARGILLGRPVNQMVISGSSFSDIHSVNASGTPIPEDADAIQVADGGTATILVENNDFRNVGKRGIKFQCDNATARNNRIVSTWTDPASVMFAGISAFGSNTTITGNSITGTNIQFGIELSAGTTNVTIDGNTVDDAAAFTPTGPHGMRYGIYVQSPTNIRITNNQVSNFRNGIGTQGGTGFTVSGNVARGVLVGTYIGSSGASSFNVSGNTFVGRGGSGSIGSYFPSNSTGTVSGNSYSTFADGVYMTGTTGVTVSSDNTFSGITRSNIYQ